MDGIKQVLQDIEATPDLLERALRLSGLVTRIFREAGYAGRLGRDLATGWVAFVQRGEGVGRTQEGGGP
jgi:hypothetical protein